MTIIKSDKLYTEKQAKKIAEEMVANDDEFTYSANLVNKKLGYWEVRWTDKDGYSERFSI